jgi:hypothetical protein
MALGDAFDLSMIDCETHYVAVLFTKSSDVDVSVLQPHGVKVTAKSIGIYWIPLPD